MSNDSLSLWSHAYCLHCDWLQGTSGPDPTTVYVDMRALRHDRYDHVRQSSSAFFIFLVLLLHLKRKLKNPANCRSLELTLTTRHVSDLHQVKFIQTNNHPYKGFLPANYSSQSEDAGNSSQNVYKWRSMTNRTLICKYYKNGSHCTIGPSRDVR